MTFNVSVIVTAYNAELYIARCINSILDQTLKNIEIIVIDDGSSDSTLEIINALKKSHTNTSIKIISRDNKGVSFSRAEGLTLINGDYFIFLDSDDWFAASALQCFYDTAIGSSADMVISNYYIYTDNKTTVIEESEANEKVDIINKMLLGKIRGFSWNKLVKTDFLKVNGITFIEGIDYLEDLLYSIKLISVADTVTFIKKPLIYYSQENDASITRFLNDDKVNDIVNAIELISTYLTSKGLSHEVSQGIIHLKMHQKYNVINSRNDKRFFMLFDECNPHIFTTKLILRKKIILYLCHVNQNLAMLSLRLIRLTKKLV